MSENLQKNDMADTLLLSIIIPVYNLQKYIARCLDSCLNQDIDLSMYEIICVDDGSTDNTYQILDEYKSKYHNIKVVHKNNEGVVKTRNAGLSLASGKYVWFVDGDDWIQPNCLKYLIDIALDGNNDMLLFREKRVKEYCTEDVKFAEYTPQYFEGGYATAKDHYVTGSGFFWFSKRIIDENNISFRPDVYYSDDTLFMAKFKPHVERMCITNALIYYYFQRSDSVSHAVKAGLHCSCMYKLAKEYRELSKRKYENYGGEDVVKKLKRAQRRAMQACIRDLCFYCNDKEFVKSFLCRAKGEKLYPFGIDFKRFRIDRKQNLKSDMMNWVFGLTSFRPYFWVCWYLMRPIRKKSGQDKFNEEDFNDNF